MEGVVSQLPEEIIHHILSFMQTKAATRTSLFCKAWHEAWLKCPTLNFSSGVRYFCWTEERKEKYLKFIKSAMQRYQEQKIGILQLTMNMIITNSCFASIVDGCIGIAVENGVQRLELDIFAHSSYALPRNLLEAKTLREIKVCGSDQVLWSDHKVMFNNLRSLHLSHIYINDVTFQGIIERCPLIEDLHIKLCVGLVRIEVNNLCNLKKITIFTWGNESVEIEAPRLQYFYWDLTRCGCSLHLHTTQELKFLSINYNLPSSGTTFFDNFEHKFPKVEDLILTVCHGLEEIDISSHSLKRIKLIRMTDLREAKINAPSLLSLEFDLSATTVFPNVSLTNVSSRSVSKISTRYMLRTYNHFSKMKEFLAKLLPSKISLVVWFDSLCKLDGVMKIPVFPAVEVEDLHLNLDYHLASELKKFLDALFMTCLPKAITLKNHRGDATKLLCQNLIARRNPGLKGVTMEIYDKTVYRWLPTVCFSPCPVIPENRFAS